MTDATKQVPQWDTEGLLRDCLMFAANALDLHSLEHWEWVAAQFYREWGVLAPGKSEPMEAPSGLSHAERRDLFDYWMRGQKDRLKKYHAHILKDHFN